MHVSVTRWAPHAALAAAVLVALTAAVVSVASTSVWPAVGGVGLVAVAAAGTAWWWARMHDETNRQLTAVQERQRATSVRDELTGCLDERGLQLVGEQVLASVRRHGDAMHAAVVAVEGLDELGELAGPGIVDEVLVAVAEGLRAETRGTDVVARWDRAEFVLVGPGTGTGPAEIERRLRIHLAGAPPAPRHVWPRRVTVGAATLRPWDGGDLADLVELACSDLSLRLALRAPATEPVRRRHTE